ncbi:hypothetical protein D3C77_282440 [compost metagenome]
MLVLAHMHGLGAGQRGADGVGAHALFQPAGTGDKAVLLVRVDEAPGAPGVQQAALFIAEHDQVTGVAQQVSELRHDLVAGGAQQRLLALEQLVKVSAGQLVEVGCALRRQAVLATARPGCLDQLGMGGGGYGHGPSLCRSSVVVFV